MLNDLYREIILDHFKAPRNHGPLPRANLTIRGNNPVCGDEVTVQLLVHDGRIEDVRFSGMGCSISQASASMMTELIKGKDLDEAVELVGAMEGMMRGHGAPSGDEFAELASLEGVRKFPSRVKCALLSWEALKQASMEYHSAPSRAAAD